MPLSMTVRTCSNCACWLTANIVYSNGYGEATCLRVSFGPRRPVNDKWMRGSDTCSYWLKKNTPQKAEGW